MMSSSPKSLNLKEGLDLSLYLVTDSTKAILQDRSLFPVVKQAVCGGVTIVQYRDKTSDTADLIKSAKRLHEITLEFRVPLIINDRVDVALAVGAEGVHLGQDDMNVETARQILGPEAIIGATVSSQDEARKAVEAGANYLGIGTVFATPTKEDTKSIIGTAGVQEILKCIASLKRTPAVAIGGINASNVQQVLHQSSAPSNHLDGVAVVSAIIAAKDPNFAASELLKLIKSQSPFYVTVPNVPKIKDITSLVNSVPYIVKKVGSENPLTHNMTNLVVQNIAANVALCIGASPIMSNAGPEASDLAALKGGLVINMGTVTREGISNYLMALQAYNKAGGPIVFDPVGAGATAVRRDAVKQLMRGGFFTLIKGNEGEIRTVWGSTIQQRGVDSGPSTSSPLDKAKLVKDLAAREHNVVLMTGATDFLSDGDRTYAIRNGHEFLGRITGSGCTLGTTIAAFLAIHREDKLLAALAGILMFEIAAENAAERDHVRGPGTFVPVFLDELYFIYRQTAIGKVDWCNKAKVEIVEV